jgi:hypothetical protein
MASLANTTIASTYPLLLKVDSNGIDGVLRAVEDGDGTDTALKLSTGAIQVDNIKIDGNTISSTDTNGNIVLSPHGSGVVTADITGDLTGNVTGNVTGNCSGTAATVTGAAQSNIESVGTLTSLTLSGDLTIPQKIIHSGDTDNYLSFGGDSLSWYQGGSQQVELIYGNIYIKNNNKALIGYNSSGGAKELIKIDGSNVVQIGEGLNAAFAGNVNATGNITTDGIFKVDSCPDNNVITFNQSNREHSFYTYFSGTTGQNRLTVRVSDGTTDGSKNDVVNFMGDLVADFQGRIIANGAAYHARASHGNVFQCDTNGNAAITLLSASNTSNSVGSDIVSLNFAATNYYSSSKDGVYGQIRCENGNGTYADRGQLVFAVGYDGATIYDRMTLSFNGTVTINNGVAYSMLNNAGNGTLNGLWAGGSDELYVGNDNGWDSIRFLPGSTEKMRITSAGYVTVGGNTTNNVNLTVNGSSGSARVVPQTDDTGYLGESNHRWQAVYATNGTVQTSDKNLKTSITSTDLGLDFINKLNPVSYKWKIGGYDITEATYDDKEEKTKRIETPVSGKRKHYGLIAQEVKEVLGNNDFGGWVKEDLEDDDSLESLRYDQFVAPLIKAVQELSAQVTALENA